MQFDRKNVKQDRLSYRAEYLQNESECSKFRCATLSSAVQTSVNLHCMELYGQFRTQPRGLCRWMFAHISSTNLRYSGLVWSTSLWVGIG